MKIFILFILVFFFIFQSCITVPTDELVTNELTYISQLPEAARNPGLEQPASFRFNIEDQGPIRDEAFKYFLELLTIPRTSGNEREVRNYLVAFAERFGLEVYTDRLNNVLIYKPGSPGRENEPPVILQAHRTQQVRYSMRISVFTIGATLQHSPLATATGRATSATTLIRCGCAPIT